MSYLCMRWRQRKLNKSGKVGEIGEIGEVGEIGEIGEVGEIGEIGEVMEIANPWLVCPCQSPPPLTCVSFGRAGVQSVANSFRVNPRLH